MIHLRQTLIALAAGLAMVPLRLAAGKWLAPLLEHHTWPRGGRLSELALGLLVIGFALAVPRLGKCLHPGFRPTWLLLLVLPFPIVNAAFFRTPEGLSMISIAVYFLGSGMSGVNEEIFLRGFGFGRDSKAVPRFTVVVNALVFGLLHLLNLTAGESGLEVTATVIFATGAGLMFGLVRMATGGIFWCALVHGLTNATVAFADTSAEGYRIFAPLMLPVVYIGRFILLFLHPAMHPAARTVPEAPRGLELL